MQRLYLFIILTTFTFSLCVEARTETIEIDGINYYLYTSRAGVITGKYHGVIDKIKESIIVEGKEYPVTSIDGAFENCTEVTSVTLPSSITYIGDASFRNCGITSFTIPESAQNMGTYVFEGCTNLTSVTIHSPMSQIKGYTFNQCTSLKDVHLPNTLENIMDGAFWDCI